MTEKLTNDNRGFEGIVWRTGKAKSGYTWYAVDLVFRTKSNKRYYCRVWLTPKQVNVFGISNEFKKGN